MGFLSTSSLPPAIGARDVIPTQLFFWLAHYITLLQMISLLVRIKLDVVLCPSILSCFLDIIREDGQLIHPDLSSL